MSFVRKINYKLSLHFLGFLAIINGFFMLISAGVSWFYSDQVMGKLLLVGGAVFLVGMLMMGGTRSYEKKIVSREGFLIVSISWVFMAVIGVLPYLVSNVVPTISDAFFESMSGYTTTGATVINDVESIPKGILFWRSFTNWIGGMGMIVLAIAIFPLLGIGGMQLFSAESPGPQSNKLSPRISETAKKIWVIYMGYTALEALLLRVFGMSTFDAINHAMSSLATGGFSTKNKGLAFWNGQPIIQYIVVLFMFLGGTNFILSYYAFKLKFKKIFKEEEFRVYMLTILSFTLIISLVIIFQVNPLQADGPQAFDWNSIEEAFRYALFNVVSVITTTGFVTTDFTQWTPFVTLLFLGIMLIGSCAGSTSGGPKIVRYMVVFKNSITEFKRMLHPHAVLPIRINKQTVPKPIVLSILGFFILYIFFFMLGTLVFSALGLDLLTALGSAATSLGNVGPGLGAFGPVGTFSELPTFGKWWSSFLMFIGRLELYTALMLFTPYFWRNF